MRIVKPSRTTDYRLRAWSELSGFGKVLIATIPIAVVVFALVIVPEFRRPLGPYAELHGIVHAVGNFDVGGGGLDGRIAVVATVALSDGRTVQAAIRQGVQVRAGVEVVVREQPQNFGAPVYGIYRTIERMP